MSCCDNSRKILSVEGSNHLFVNDALGATAEDIVSVTLDLRSGSLWHLNASSVSNVVAANVSGSNTLTSTLRYNQIYADGRYGPDVYLAQGDSTVTQNSSEVVTLARSDRLSRGVYEITLASSSVAPGSGVPTLTLQGATGGTGAITLVSAQATLESLYL